MAQIDMMRQWMIETARLCETFDEPSPSLAPTQMLALVRKVRARYRGTLCGQCEGAAGDLVDLLTRRGYSGTVIQGRYAKPFHWQEGDISPMSGHTWVKVGPWILDPTREQFGSSNLVIHEHDAEALLYHADAVSESFGDPLVEKIVYRDHEYTVAINPSKREFAANFSAEGAAGVLTRDGLLVVGDGPALDHLSLLRMASVDEETEQYRLQVYDGRVEVELLDDDIEDTANPEPTTQYPKAVRDAIRAEVAANQNIRAIGWPVVISLRCDGDSILKE